MQQQRIYCLDLRALQRLYGGTKQFNHNRSRHGTVYTGGLALNATIGAVPLNNIVKRHYRTQERTPH